MAEEQAAAAAVEEHQEDTAEQFANADAQANPDTEAPLAPSVDEIAGRMGWVPQDKFKGPAEKWKPADQFILDGKDIQERTSRELKEIRGTLETVSKTTGAIIAERLAAQRDELARQHAAAVERGDAGEALKLGGQLATVESRAEAVVRPQPGAPTPEAQEWAAKHSRLMRDPIAARRAVEICNQYAAAGYSTGEQLSSTEAIVRREFPHLFDDKPAPQVNGTISRNSAPAAKGQTAADLPAAAKAIAQDLVDQGQIPNIDAYAKHYFANLAKGK